MRHPQTYPVNLNTVFQTKKDAPGVNSFRIDLVGVIKTPEDY